MNKVFFAAIIALLIAGCNSETKENGTKNSDKNADLTAIYEKNLATVKSLFANFEKKDLSSDAGLIADSVKWTSPSYGDTVTTKSHWIESLKSYTDNWDSIHFNNSNFLPGLDPVTHEPNGSVRCYGRWDGNFKSSHLATKLNYYGTFEFNKENKIASAAEYFDAGGLMNAVSKK